MTTISIVTPCLNDAAHIAATMASVLDGSDRPDEYVVVDGESTDGTAELIQERAGELAWWTSEQDEGQYAAIARGFEHTTGDVMAWLNGGDLYMPWTIDVVRELFDTFPDLRWLTTQRPMFADERGRVVACEFVGGFSRDSFLAGANLPGGAWFARAGIQQESTFWRRSLWEAAGAHLEVELDYAGDFELWLRFFRHSELVALDGPLGVRRTHTGQKTSDLAPYVAEAQAVLAAAGTTLARSAPRDTARRLAQQGLANRPLRRLPSPLAAPLRAAGVLHRVPTIVWRDGAWLRVDDYAV